MVRVMTAVAICALAAAVAGHADDPEPDTAKAELKKLQGKWTVTRLIRNGKESKARPGLTFTFDADKLVTTQTVSAKGKGKFERTESYKVKLDTKKKPHTIDLVPDRKGAGMSGVYKIEKGELYLARVWREGLRRAAKAPERPKDLKGEGEGETVYTMTREKAKEKGKG